MGTSFLLVLACTFEGLEEEKNGVIHSQLFPSCSRIQESQKIILAFESTPTSANDGKIMRKVSAALFLVFHLHRGCSQWFQEAQ